MYLDKAEQGQINMALEYDVRFRWMELLPVLDEHTAWFHDLLKIIFYQDKAELAKPVSFARWLVHANGDDGIQLEVIEKLTRLHIEMLKMAENLRKHVETAGQKPFAADFQNFMTVYEEFILCIRRLEKDFIHEDTGYDSFTGLRSPKNLHSDFDREMQRMARQGRSFCIALARIDNFSSLKMHYSKNECDAYVKLVSELIKLSIRSFDDAYHMGGDEFVLCLKQANVTGGFSALERLRRELELQEIFLTIGGQDKRLSMSCCIAEPVDGDTIEDLLANLRQDLSGTEKKSDLVLEYHELSPLQRLIKKDTHTTLQ